MPPMIRNLFPYLAIFALAGAVVWALSRNNLPRADFAFTNGDQARTVDPSLAVGQPEGRIVNALFEGLLRSIPEPGGARPENFGKNVPQVLQPGVAEMPEISQDGKTYTFRIRDGVKWSNGRRMTAHDFVFSWQRMLHPETTSEYAYQLHYIQGAEAYNAGRLAVGDAVEVELPDRRDRAQPFPRGTILRGKLAEIHEPPKPQFDEDTTKQQQEDALAAWRRKFVYAVETRRGLVHYSPAGEDAAEHFPGRKVHHCQRILPDFDATVGIKAPDDKTLVVTLNSPTPYFNELVAFYPLYPVCRECVEEHGSPDWTKPENIVSNGPFRMVLHRMRDRIRMVKSDTYWDRDNVKLNTIDALAVKQDTTALNMYMTGQVDWVTVVPNSVITELKKRQDFHSTPMLTIYMYRLNVQRKPLDNVLVRRALNAAINKQEICEQVVKAGQVPARSFVPPGLPGYKNAYCGDYDLDEARRLLAEAGYPNGQGMERIQILYNSNEDHRMIAEVVQQQWNRLGIKCELRNLEWGSFQTTLQNTDYMVGRSGWIGDYPDPNTFLDLFVTGGANNQTNWSNEQYDALIEKAKVTSGEERQQLLTQAEQILMDEMPVIPVYFQVSRNLVNPRVQGFTSNIQDLHPLEVLSIKE